MTRITRRAALIGGTAAITTISPGIAEVYRTGAVDIDDQLVELAERFKRDAMAIDPTIKGMWLGCDMTFRDREAAVFSITFERAGSEFFKPGRGKREAQS